MVIIVVEILFIGHRPTELWEAGFIFFMRWAFEKVV
jgi:hypothetical protein